MNVIEAGKKYRTGGPRGKIRSRSGISRGEPVPENFWGKMTERLRQRREKRRRQPPKAICTRRFGNE